MIPLTTYKSLTPEQLTVILRPTMTVFIHETGPYVYTAASGLLHQGYLDDYITQATEELGIDWESCK